MKINTQAILKLLIGCFIYCFSFFSLEKSVGQTEGCLLGISNNHCEPILGPGGNIIGFNCLPGANSLMCIPT